MVIVLVLGLQVSEEIESASKAFDRACQEYEESLVELGPAAVESLTKIAESLDPGRRPIVQRAVERIRRDQKPLERLVEDLGAQEIEVRDRATRDLMNIGRPARSYLVTASRSADPEVADRAKLLLGRLRRVGPSRARWARVVESETARIAELRKRVDLGLATEGDLADAEGALLRARCRAGVLSFPDYLRQEQERASADLKRVSNLFDRGVVPSRQVLEAKIRLAFVGLRLGKASESDLWTLQSDSAAQLRSLHDKGVLTGSEYEKGLDAILQDPYEEMEMP